MNKQIFTLMLGAAIFSISSVFAMEYEEAKRGQSSTPAAPKIDRSKLEVLDIAKLPTLTIPDFNAFYGIKFGEAHKGYIKTPTGDVYGVDMGTFQATVNYLRKKPFETGLQKKLNMEIMPTKKIVDANTIYFIYDGGDFTLPNPWHTYSSDEPTTKACTLTTQRIILKKIAPNFYN